MPGYQHDKATQLNAINELLRERYQRGDGSITVIKELLQNADDAQAKHVSFLVLPNGLSEANNPLLKEPSLLILNDGSFSPKHRRGITSWSGAQKAVDQATVGRFGLGQKSVFHLCDAWFYLGRSHTSSKTLSGVISPWLEEEEGEEYSAVNKFDETDQQYIRTLLGSRLPPEGFLLLWLPLRRPAQRNIFGGLLKENEVQPKEVLDDLVRSDQLLPILAQLASVEKVEVCQWEDGAVSPKTLHQISASNGRLGRPFDANYKEFSFSFSISRSTEDTQPAGVLGACWQQDTVRLQKIRQNAAWPTRYRSDGQLHSTAEKAVGHAGITLLRYVPKEGSAQFNIRWAVFLPFEPQNLGRLMGDESVEIILHGYFFPDSARREIPGITKDDAELSGQWNETLLRDLLYPRLLPFIEKTFAELKLNLCSELLTKLSASEFWRKHCSGFCEKYILVRQVTANNEHWALLDPKTALIPLPTGIMRDILRKTNIPGAVLVADEAPYLTNGQSQMWLKDHTIKVEQKLLVEALQNSGEVEALNQWLKTLNAEARVPLRSLLRHLHRNWKTKKLLRDSVRDAVRKLVELIGEECYFIQADSEQALDILAQSDMIETFLPAIIGVKRENTFIRPSSAVGALKLLGNAAVQENDELRRQIGNLAAQILKLTTRTEVMGDPSLRECRFFRVYGLGGGETGQHRLRTIIEVEQARKEGRLFSRGNIQKQTLAKAAVECAINPPELLVLEEEDIAKHLDAVPLDALGISQLFVNGTLKVSSEVEVRRVLLDEFKRDIAGKALSPQVEKAIILLAHGDKSLKHDDITIWNSNDISELLIEKLLSKSVAHRLVPQKIITVLDRAWDTCIGLKLLTKEKLLDLLDEFEARDLREVIRSLNNEQCHWLILAAQMRPNLWRKLPIHSTQKGNELSLRAHAYLASDHSAPDMLEVDIVNISADVELAEIQRQILKPWSYEIEFSLWVKWVGSPVHRAKGILNCLQGNHRLSLPESLDWLPLKDETKVVKHRDVYLFPNGMWSIFSKIPSNNRLLGLGDVCTSVCNHPELTKHLRNHDDLADSLVEWLKNNPQPQLLVLPLQAKQYAKVGLSINALASLPGWLILQELNTSSWKLLDSLCGDMPLENMRSLVNILGKKCHDDGIWTGEIWNLYTSVLGCALKIPKFCTYDILLPTELQTWKSANAIACTRGGWSAEFQLHPGVALEEISFLTQKLISKNVFLSGDSAKLIADYFRDWSNVASEAIGVFLALLGNGQKGSIRTLCQQMLGQSSRELVWAKIANTTESGIHPKETESLDVEIYISKSAMAITQSLMGEEIEVQIADDAKAPHLLIEPERLFHLQPYGSKTIPLYLRPEPSATKRLELLFATIRLYLQRVLKVQILDGFYKFWDAYSRAGQVSVEATRRKILGELPPLLDELGVKEERNLHHQVRELDRAKQVAFEYEGERINSDRSNWENHRNADAFRKQEQARQALERLVDTDPKIHEFILGRVREKLKNFQYSLGRVIYELVQNADDAVFQRREINGVENLRTELKIHVDYTPPRVTIIHWGRPINAYEGAKLTAEEGRRRGYDLDLNHMMRLNVSDKDRNVTGRFGLGFKSIHLLTNAPHIQSGLVGFQIVAGFLPQRMEAPPPHHPNDQGGSTTISLPLRPDINLKEVIDAPKRCLPYLPAFSLALGSVTWVDEGGMTCNRWNGTPLIGIMGVEYGILAEGGDMGHRRFLRFQDPHWQTGPRPALLVEVRHGKVVALPEDIPTLWCSLPTELIWKLGILLNGPFTLDQGRAQISQTSEPFSQYFAWLSEQFQQLSHQIFMKDKEMLNTLAALSPDPGNLLQSLLALIVEACTKCQHEGIKAMLVKSIRPAFLNYPVLNSGLPIPWAGQVQIDKQIWVLPEEVCTPEVAKALYSFPKIIEHLPYGCVVAHSAVKSLVPLEGQIKKLTLKELLEHLLPKKEVNVNEASAFGKLVREVGIVRFRTMVPEWLAELSFLNGKGEFKRAGSLLLSSKLKDTDIAVLEKSMQAARSELQEEWLRAQLAPNVEQLHPDYCENMDATVFFLTARSKLEASIEKMKSWVHELLSANQEQGRRLLLNYVKYGELGDKLIYNLGRSALNFSTSAEWVAWAQSYGELTNDHLHRLTITLFPDPKWQDRHSSEKLALGDIENDNFIIAPQPNRAHRSLNCIWQWWRREKHIQSQRWEEKVYPKKWCGGQLREALKAEDNEAWLVLFVVALNERLGRTQEGQGAVGFIQLLEASGWWQCLIERPEVTFLPELKAWLKKDEQYRTYDEWLSLIPWMYQARVWMEDYRLLLRNPIRAIGKDSFTNLWRPGVNPELRGTGIDAPLFQQMIGLSGHFILRELLRMRVVEDPLGELSHHAYVPRLAVRRFLGLLGLSEEESANREMGSNAIFQFIAYHLGEPTFSGSFDLPIRIVALDQNLRNAAWNGNL